MKNLLTIHEDLRQNIHQVSPKHQFFKKSNQKSCGQLPRIATSKTQTSAMHSSNLSNKMSRETALLKSTILAKRTRKSCINICVGDLSSQYSLANSSVKVQNSFQKDRISKMSKSIASNIIKQISGSSRKDQVVRRVMRTQVSESEIVEKKNYFFDFSRVSNWQIFTFKIQQQLTRLQGILSAMNEGRDPYKELVGYIDLIQDVRFDECVMLLADTHFRKLFKYSFVQERLSIFLILFLELETFIEKDPFICSKLIEWNLKSALIYQKLLYDDCINFVSNSSSNSTSGAQSFIEFYQKNIQRKFREIFSNKVTKEEFNSTLLNYQTKISAFINAFEECGYAEIDSSLTKIRNDIEDLGADEVVDSLLECFSNFFISKGVLTSEEYEQELLLPPGDEKPTLVVDLDETLIHFAAQTRKVFVRPFTNLFLDEMAKIFEVVVFTAAQQDYADWILNKIDPDNRISHRLYRQHVSVKGSEMIKDLSLLGRDLSRTVILDNVSSNFQLQPDNGILIQGWFGDLKDTELKDIIPFLTTLATIGCQDVRPRIAVYKKLSEEEK